MKGKIKVTVPRVNEKKNTIESDLLSIMRLELIDQHLASSLLSFLTCSGILLKTFSDLIDVLIIGSRLRGKEVKNSELL